MNHAHRTTQAKAEAASFLLETNFFAGADSMRKEFEKQTLGSLDENDGFTPFAYAFEPDAYQFLSASAESLFSAGLLKGLIERLRSWGGERLGLSHVSTPHVRVYINGCSRELLSDSVSAPWHYMLALGNQRAVKAGRIKLVTGNPDEQERTLTLTRVLSLQLESNQLLVHNTAHAYAIEPIKSSMNPLDGVVFLDGYLW
jgi:hypothetical protein